MLTFASPFILFALALLPAIWWLLHIMPPQPRTVRFPAIEFLRGMIPERKETAHTPLWLLILRMLLLTCVILALADPVMNRDSPLPGQAGPVLLVVDNGWEAAVNWDARQKMLDRIARQAAGAGRALLFLATAPSADGGALRISDPARVSEAGIAVRKFQPMPWGKDYRKVIDEAFKPGELRSNPHILWLSDGFEDAGGSNTTNEFIMRLRALGPLTVIRDETVNAPFFLERGEKTGNDLTFRVMGNAAVTVLAEARDGRILAEQKAPLAPGDASREVSFELLPEMRQQVARVFIREKPQASATYLLDGGQWRPVGILAEEGTEKSEGYLSDAFYLTRALEPFADVASGNLSEVLEKERAVIVWPDSYILSTVEKEKLQGWVEGGGHLVRFAGANLGKAEAAGERALLPVDLRSGGRSLEGALVWSVPQKIAPLAKDSPLYGLDVPDDVTIGQQVLAEPSPMLEDAAIVRLEDGTPLVTSALSGQGRITLIHTTAGPEWSNVSLSGFYVGMLRRFVEMGPALALSSDSPLAELRPLRLMDGFGRLQAPSMDVLAVRGHEFPSVRPGPRTPPGFYGSGASEKALNLSGHIKRPQRIEKLPEGVDVVPYTASQEEKFKPQLLLAALLLFVIDTVASLWLQGMLPFFARRALPVVLCLLMMTGSSSAATDEVLAKYAGHIYFAWIRTGDGEQDRISETGLQAVCETVSARTSSRCEGVTGVLPDAAELALFPLVYWPMTPGQASLSDDAARNLRAYLSHGGLLLVDTRDGQFDAGGSRGAGLGERSLRDIMQGFNPPPLMTLPREHVLTRSFYLLDDFPGRWTGGELWVEKTVSSAYDNVPTLIIGGNDWASAWASAAGLPGGERQRERALRFGVNLAMVAMTGSYKADQVHMPHILRRLGQ